MIDIDPKVAALFQLQYEVNTAPTPPAFKAAADRRDALAKSLTETDRDRAAFIANCVLRLVRRT